VAIVSFKAAEAINYGYGNIEPSRGIPRVGGYEEARQQPVEVDQGKFPFLMCILLILIVTADLLYDDLTISETMATAETMQVYYDDLLRLQNIMENDMIPTQHVQQFNGDDDDY
jgi:hypothetical protein